MTGAELKALRKAAGWTAKQLAADLGVHERSVWRWETSDQVPRLAARAARVTLEPPARSPAPASGARSAGGNGGDTTAPLTGAKGAECSDTKVTTPRSAEPTSGHQPCQAR